MDRSVCGHWVEIGERDCSELPPRFLTPFPFLCLSSTRLETPMVFAEAMTSRIKYFRNGRRFIRWNSTEIPANRGEQFCRGFPSNPPENRKIERDDSAFLGSSSPLFHKVHTSHSILGSVDLQTRVPDAPLHRVFDAVCVRTRCRQTLINLAKY